jgi:hypothetical protein
MITVLIDRDSDRNIVSLVFTGHALFDKSGKDIVCAGVSTLFYTTANSLEDICGLSTDSTCRIVEEDGDVNARILLPGISDKDILGRAQVIMRTCQVGLMSLADDVNDGKRKYIELIETRK